MPAQHLRQLERSEVISSNVKPHLSDSYPLQNLRRCMLSTLHLPVATAQDAVSTIWCGSALLHLMDTGACPAAVLTCVQLLMEISTLLTAANMPQ